MRSTRIAAVTVLLAAACTGDGDEAGETTSGRSVGTTGLVPDAPTATTAPPTATVVATAPPTIDDAEAAGGSHLYVVDLTTGTATPRGRIGGQAVGVFGLAFAPGGGPSTVYALTDGPELVTFDAASPEALAASVPITGVSEGSTLLALDVDPADERVLALSDAGVLYAIDPANGLATALGTGLGTPLPGPGFGFDVDPTAGAIRIDVATGGQLLVDQATGALAGTAAPISFRPDDVNAATTPRVVAIAHGEDGLYGIDAATGSLVWQDPPDDGELTTVGPLGVAITDGASLDISGTSGEVLLAVPG